ncbi:zinc-binding dehydrogenase [Paracoccus versutus]|uniref:zinc-binding dehydrogenase n=1 Tax=Paracoccus versutus TaxID=34007 RepID=UPI000DF763C3|nr:hypothetical protein DVR11_14840 [Paracoccus versutus]
MPWPSIAHCTADRAEYEAAAGRLFAALQEGRLRAAEPRTYRLAQAALAQADAEARRTTGSVVLIP